MSETSDPAASAAPAPARKSRRFLGCLIAAGVTLVVVAIVLTIVIVRLMRPAPVVAGHVLVTPSTLAIVQVEPDVDDPEIHAMVSGIADLWIRKSQQQQKLPPNMQWLKSFQRKPNPAEATEQMESLLPSDVAVGLESSDDGDPQIVAVASFPRLPRLQMRLYAWMFTMGSHRSEYRTTRRTYRIYNHPRRTGWYATLRGNTVLMASSRERLHTLLDRVDAGTPLTVDTDVAREYGRIASQGHGRAVMHLDEEVVDAVTRAGKTHASQAQKARFDVLSRITRQMGEACDQATWQSSVTSADSIETIATIRCRTAEDAEKVEQALPPLLLPYEQKLTTYQMTVQRGIEASDDGIVTVTWTVNDVLRGVETAIDDMYSRGGYATPAPLGTTMP